MPLCWQKNPGHSGKVLFFNYFVQMALWDTLGSGMDQHFAPELFAGTSKTTTFYKGLDVIGYHIKNTAEAVVFEHVA